MHEPPGPPARPFRVAVVGAGDAAPSLESTAEAVGRALGEAGAALVCGGRTGVMEAAARGCSAAGGLTLGVLPGSAPGEASAWVAVPLPTAMGEGRNVLVVRFAEAVIALGGGWGTLSEVALASKMGRPVVLVGEGPAPGLSLPREDEPREAVRWALEAVRTSRSATAT